MVLGKIINMDRLWNRLMRLTKIGAAQKGGVCRLALGKEDKLDRDIFVNWCRELDCQVRVWYKDRSIDYIIYDDTKLIAFR
jgi:N-carbamoyl-L-amino-acid hydrolase